MPSKNNIRPSIKNAVRKRVVWFIKNTTTEGPGYLSELLNEWKVPFRICDLQRGDRLPKTKSYDAVIVLGGPMSANDQTETMIALLKWIQGLLKKKTPYFGICLGLQTLVKAAGGKVVKSPVKEIGLRMKNGRPFKCTLTRVGKRDLLFHRFKTSFSTFQLHGETVKLIKPMALLAEGQGCRNQIVKVRESAYGIQGHLEMTGPLLKDWLAEDADLKLENADKMLRQWHLVEKELHHNCRTMLLNFLKIAEILS